MTALLESKLAERVKKLLSDEDQKQVDKMTSPNLTDWGQYQRCVGARKAIAVAIEFIDQTWQDIQKE